MDEGIAKGDLTEANGIGVDNMTCIVVKIN